MFKRLWVGTGVLCALLAVASVLADTTVDDPDSYIIQVDTNNDGGGTFQVQDFNGVGATYTPLTVGASQTIIQSVSGSSIRVGSSVTMSGGINNTNGGITNSGALTGVTNIDLSGNIVGGGNISVTGSITSAGGISNSGGILNAGGIVNAGGLNNGNSGITNAGALSGVTNLNMSGNLISGGNISTTGSISTTGGLITAGGITNTGVFNNSGSGINNTGQLNGVSGIALTGDITGVGNISTTGYISVTGNINAAGSTVFGDGVGGDTHTFNGATLLNGDATVSGTFTTQGAVVNNGGVTTNGTVTNNGSVTTNGNMAVTSQNGQGTLGVSGSVANTYNDGTQTRVLNQAVTVGGGMAVTGNFSAVSGTNGLYVGETQNTTVGGNMVTYGTSVRGGMLVTGDLGVNGNIYSLNPTSNVSVNVANNGLNITGSTDTVTLTSDNNTSTSDGRAQVQLTPNSAGLLVTNALGNTHGVQVGTSRTSISGGVNSTNMILDDAGARFENAATGAPTRVTGIADGVSDYDAVNMKQYRKLDNKIEDTQQGVAAIAAMTNIPALEPDRRFGLGVGVGYFEGNNALAGSASLRATERVSVKASLSAGSRGTAAMGGGVTFSW
jgi:hypothetical protein